LRRLDTRPPEHAANIELPAGIPIFAPLNEVVLEHLASALRPQTLAADEIVFREGGEGDEFYAIEDGEVEVLKGEQRVTTLGPGGYFGEIALLQNVPRTATIRTLTAVRLQRLERTPFLDTITGNPASSDAADAIVGARMSLQAGFTSL